MLVKPGDDQSVENAKGNEKGKESAFETLFRLASTARLYRSIEGRLYARVPVGDRHEICRLDSSQFRDWLSRIYLDGHRDPPSLSAIRRVVSLLETGQRDVGVGGVPTVFIRVGGEPAGDGEFSSYYLDLGDPSGRAVEIRAEGWSVVDRPEVHFRRPEGMLPLPAPGHDGSIDLLRPYVNLSTSDFLLMIVWLTTALRPIGPYPVLAIHGEQGTAKSTLARILQLLIDPQSSGLLGQPRSTRDLMATAVNGWLLAYDNISVIPNWLSESLCQIVFGGSIAGRALFSDDRRSVIHAQRPVILNGIDDFVRRGDLMDRTVFLHLRPILAANRRAQDEFWRSFRADYPRILGGVLDAVVAGQRLLPTVCLPELPRMADYAKWGVAVGRGLGWGPDSFLSTYLANRKEATLQALEDSAIGTILLKLIPQVTTWMGTSTELLAILAESAGTKTAASARWPRTPSQFSNEVRRLAPQLGMHGLSIRFSRNYEQRLILLTTVDHTNVPLTGATETPETS